MTRAKVDAGACGFTARIEVTSLDRDTVRVVLESECEQITGMNPDMDRLNWREGVFCRMADSAIYQSASEHVRHAACPIPTAILRAIEAEVGIALPKNVEIHFES